MIESERLASDNSARPANYRDARVLVTGGAGFLGRHIVRYLADRGAEVIAGVRQGRANEARSVFLDVTDVSSIEAVLESERLTHVINCAAYGVDQREQSYGDAFAVNVKGCRDLVKAAARMRVSRFIHIGTCSEYASSESAISEEAPQRPHNLYALSKAAGTLAALDGGAMLGIDVMAVRPFGLWGPGEPEFRIIPQVVTACRKRVPLALTECDVVRDYSFVTDAAEWISRVAFAPTAKPGSIINIGSGRPIVLRDFVLEVAARLNGAELMEFGKRPQRPNEPKSVVANIGRLKSLIGQMAHTSLDDGLRSMLSERSSSPA